MVQKNQNIANELYEIPWYNLPPSTVKQLCYAILNVQNGSVMTMGPFGDVDFEMATEVSFTNLE